jgi:hypothetical protein
MRASGRAGIRRHGTAYLSAVMADTPYLVWPLGEASGAHAADASGNLRVGTFENGITLGQPGYVGGGAVRFDGSNDAVTAIMPGAFGAVEALLYLPSNLTSVSPPYALWFGTSGGSVPRQGVFLGGGVTGDVTDEVLTYLQADLSGNYQAVGYCGSGVTLTTGWHHVVASYSTPLAQMTLYWDGARVDNQHAGSGPAAPVGGTSLCLGGYQPGVNPLLTNCRVSYFACYATELSAARIAAHHAAALIG